MSPNVRVRPRTCISPPITLINNLQDDGGGPTERYRQIAVQRFRGEYPQRAVGQGKIDPHSFLTTLALVCTLTDDGLDGVVTLDSLRWQ